MLRNNYGPVILLLLFIMGIFPIVCVSELAAFITCELGCAFKTQITSFVPEIFPFRKFVNIQLKISVKV